jgi:hypothetical protein
MFPTFYKYNEDEDLCVKQYLNVSVNGVRLCNNNKIDFFVLGLEKVTLRQIINKCFVFFHFDSFENFQ